MKPLMDRTRTRIHHLVESSKPCAIAQELTSDGSDWNLAVAEFHHESRERVKQAELYKWETFLQVFDGRYGLQKCAIFTDSARGYCWNSL